VLTLVVVEETEQVVGCDPGEDALLLAGKDARAVLGRVVERVERRVAHHRVDVSHHLVHAVFQQQPHPCRPRHTIINGLHRTTNSRILRAAPGRA